MKMIKIVKKHNCSKRYGVNYSGIINCNKKWVGKLVLIVPLGKKEEKEYLKRIKDYKKAVKELKEKKENHLNKLREMRGGRFQNEKKTHN